MSQTFDKGKEETTEALAGVALGRKTPSSYTPGLYSVTTYDKDQPMTQILRPMHTQPSAAVLRTDAVEFDGDEWDW